jgi:hypothetical protein
MIAEAERRFPARIRIAVPPQGLGQQLDQMTAWLDANCGAGNWAMTPAGRRGAVNDAFAIYFLDPALANAFVALVPRLPDRDRGRRFSGAAGHTRRARPRETAQHALAADIVGGGTRCGIGAQQHDARPPYMLLRAVPRPDHGFQPLAITRTEPDLDAAHPARRAYLRAHWNHSHPLGSDLQAARLTGFVTLTSLS